MHDARTCRIITCFQLPCRQVVTTNRKFQALGLQSHADGCTLFLNPWYPWQRLHQPLISIKTHIEIYDETIVTLSVQIQLTIRIWRPDDRCTPHLTAPPLPLLVPSERSLTFDSFFDMYRFTTSTVPSVLPSSTTIICRTCIMEVSRNQTNPKN